MALPLHHICTEHKYVMLEQEWLTAFDRRAVAAEDLAHRV